MLGLQLQLNLVRPTDPKGEKYYLITVATEACFRSINREKQSKLNTFKYLRITQRAI